MQNQPVPGSSLLRRRIERETDPVIRRNLQIVHEHIQSERTVDVERTMATMVPKDCALISYNWRANSFETAMVSGYDEVCEAYKRRRLAGVFSNFNIDRVVADADTVVTEGILQANLPGRAAIANGHVVDDVEAEYLIEARAVVTWPMSKDGLIESENVFLAAGAFQGLANRKLTPGTVWPPEEMP